MIPFLDLSRVHQPLAQELSLAFERVLADGQFILGPDVAALEDEFAAWCGAEFAVGVSSGTDALLAALMALEIGPGDEVIVPAFSFFATAGCVARLGATPVFVDVEPDTLLMDVSQAVAAQTARTRAVIPVHLFGQCVDTEPLQAAGLVVLEDAAQAHGAQDGQGRRAGAQGVMGCFSFFPSKPLGAFGDAGMVTTSDRGLADRLRLIRRHGARPKYHHQIVGGNFRLDALQAALLRVKMPYLEGWARERRRIHERYVQGLSGVVDVGALRFLERAPGTHVYHQHTLRVAGRDALRAALEARGIGAMVYYPEPLHTQPCFDGIGGLPVGALPHAEAACAEVLAIPCYPGLSAAEQNEIMRVIKRFYGI